MKNFQVLLACLTLLRLQQHMSEEKEIRTRWSKRSFSNEKVVKLVSSLGCRWLCFALLRMRVVFFSVLLKFFKSALISFHNIKLFNTFNGIIHFASFFQLGKKNFRSKLKICFTFS